MPRFLLLAVSLCALLLPACATIQVGTLPAPPPTAKLRLCVLPVSDPLPPGRFWGIPHQEYTDLQYQGTARIFAAGGIYQVIDRSAVQAVLGDQVLMRWQLEPDGWSLARRIGRALHADYVLVSVRGLENPTGGKFGTYFWESILINISNGRQFGVYFPFPKTNLGERGIPKGTLNVAYRELFRDAKSDMLETALYKSRLVAPGAVAAAGGGKGAAAPKKSPEPASGAGDSRGKVRTVDLEKALEPAPPAAGRVQLVVYDLEAPDYLKPAALILSESLREELLNLGRFTLVNRENLRQMMDETKFQMSGLVDEKKAIELGRGLAANQIVTGKLGSLGATLIMQAKRTDVESFGTRAMGSIKCSLGKEEELMSQTSALARILSAAP